MGKYDNKNVVITGGASGIGWAISEEFAKEGAKVYMLEVKTEEGNRKIESKGFTQEEITCLECDVSNQTTVRSCMEEIVNKSGRIHILINNAGIAHVGDALSTTEEDIDRIYNVNIKGVYNCIHTVLPNMIEAGGGVILNMASIAATVGISDRFAYSMSKGAVLTMTYSVAKDYIDKGIRCNSISPARVHTPFVDGFIAKNYPGKEEEMFEALSRTQPIGRMADPVEIARLAIYLCSDDAGFITGTDYPIDGGFIKLNS
ncbi:SDR family NAD(P)-dependent oxidoreductase [Membranihabitans maritimus]|uniref:SDR family NAD(P)-dependent oxidoreductase n=1 Tax=Membranihabitans maritimus TaxID=2904244 RepID=UPI001F003156|nr:glucose 1-dehydrogenase [Membranihabitans maritimus]